MWLSVGISGALPKSPLPRTKVTLVDQYSVRPQMVTFAISWKAFGLMGPFDQHAKDTTGQVGEVGLGSACHCYLPFTSNQHTSNKIQVLFYGPLPNQLLPFGESYFIFFPVGLKGSLSRTGNMFIFFRDLRQRMVVLFSGRLFVPTSRSSMPRHKANNRPTTDLCVLVCLLMMSFSAWS